MTTYSFLTKFRIRDNSVFISVAKRRTQYDSIVSAAHELYRWLLEASKNSTAKVQRIKAHTDVEGFNPLLNDAADTEAHLAHFSARTRTPSRLHSKDATLRSIRPRCRVGPLDSGLSEKTLFESVLGYMSGRSCRTTQTDPHELSSSSHMLRIPFIEWTDPTFIEHGLIK